MKAPGPGNYKIPLSTFTKTKFNAVIGRKKRKLSIDAKFPGREYLPQKKFYNPKNKNMFSFGKSKLSRTMMDEAKKTLPGPGQYNSTKFLIMKKNPRCVIGSAKRILGKKIENVPGVGTYNMNKYWNHRHKKTGFSIKRKKRFQSLGVRVNRKMSRELGHSRIISIIRR